jgi:ribonuclease HI
MLSLPILKDRIGKWILALSKFDLTYQSAKEIKEQVMADLVTQHCGPDVAVVEHIPWTLFFDGPSCGVGAGIGIVLISPQGTNYEFSIPIEKTSTKNQSEYQAVLKGIKLLREVNAEVIEIFEDSQLVINQLAGEYECKYDILRIYHEECLQLLREFKIVKLKHIPKCYNSEANRLAQGASGYRPILVVELPAEDWRKEIMDYRKDPSKKVDKQLRYMTIKYILLEDDLYYRTIDEVLLKCLGEEEAKTLMGEIHEGVYGAHQSTFKMKWMIRNNNYYWTTILEDCFKYYKGCQECRKFGSIQRVPTSAMNPIIKPWLFRGWAIDLIGQICPPSSKGHKFVLVATDYFTKWVEAIPIKTVTSDNMIDFVKEHIVYRFGIPQTITTDQGSQFTLREFEEYTNSLGINLLNLSPYYAQAKDRQKQQTKASSS